MQAGTGVRYINQNFIEVLLRPKIITKRTKKSGVLNGLFNDGIIMFYRADVSTDEERILNINKFKINII